MDFLFLDPVLKHMIWGGTKLRTEFGYQEEGSDLGECWGISAHPNGDCLINNPEYYQQKLSELWLNEPQLFGMTPSYTKTHVFPLLIKIINASSNLSIQVHPDDSYAYLNEDNALGKTECWYILNCQANSELIIGHNASTREELEDMILNKKWNQFLRKVPVHPGDFIQIDPGTVHAITAGITLLETQQNSDITYRIYDYDRLSNGQPRPLHVQKSLDVITVPAKSVEDSIIPTSTFAKNQFHKLYQCSYYNVYEANIINELSFSKPGPYLLISVVEGFGTVNGNPVKKGDHFIALHSVQTIHCKGNFQIIASTPGDNV